MKISFPMSNRLLEFLIRSKRRRLMLFLRNTMDKDQLRKVHRIPKISARPNESPPTVTSKVTSTKSSIQLPVQRVTKNQIYLPNVLATLASAKPQTLDQPKIAKQRSGRAKVKSKFRSGEPGLMDRKIWFLHRAPLMLSQVVAEINSYLCKGLQAKELELSKIRPKSLQ